MEVKLLAHTPDPMKLIAAAARSCYSDKPASQLLDESIPKAHGSVYEHAVFTFSIEGISRVCSHQLVRHRIAAVSQQSMRYVKTDKLWSDDFRDFGESMVLPDSVQDLLSEEYEESETVDQMHLRNVIGQYVQGLDTLIKTLQDAGVKSEDIRYFLPNGVKTNVVVTMNYRELLHVCGVRRCTRAQAEIREVFDKVAELVKEACPDLYENSPLVPQCKQLGYCPEHKSCGLINKID